MTARTTKKIGLFGGTFDPVHYGHLILAEHIREQGGLDEILFIPAHIHPLKDNSEISQASHRLQMLQLAISGNPYFSISEIEITQNTTSYTIDTIRQLSAQYPDRTDLVFLLGSDNIAQFHLWHQPQELLSLCRFLVFGRSGSSDAIADSPYKDQFEFVAAPLIEISSTEIRQRCQRQLSIRYLVPERVATYIQRNHLYGGIDAP